METHASPTKRIIATVNKIVYCECYVCSWNKQCYTIMWEAVFSAIPDHSILSAGTVWWAVAIW